MRTKFEVAQIISRFKALFYEKYAPCPQVRKVFGHLEQCRTAELGGHVDACPECGAIRVSYNSCRNRHCPKCQGVERELWIQARKEDLLPVKYFHVVFTLPDALDPVSLGNMRTVYNSLFSAAWDTLSTFARNKGVQGGMISVLHTWGSNLHYHPHLHCIVPCGGLDNNGMWKKLSSSGKESPFLFPVKAMSKVFRAKFMAALTRQADVTPQIRKKLFRTEWIVYSKSPFCGAGKVLEYLGRYSHRVAISNNRIKNVTDRTVTFDYKDYRAAGKHKERELTGEEFLHQYSLHILPHGFVRIRHYGFLAGCNREKLRNIQIQMDVTPSSMKRGKKIWTEVCKQNWEEYNLCKHCGKAQMVTVEVFARTRAPPNRFEAKLQESAF